MDSKKEENTKKSLQVVKDFIELVKSSNDPRMKALVDDLRDQVMQAFSKDEFYNKWGIHYLPSLIRAHLLQQCTNFKDPGLQNYGGTLFRQIRDQLDDIFLNLPAPKPSIKAPPPKNSNNNNNNSNVKYTPPAPVNMKRYHNIGNGCFHGDCSVLMKNGTQKLVKNIRKGDIIMSPNGPSTVLCTIEFPCKDSKTDLVELEGGLLLTPYHPIRIHGKWNFPCEIAPVLSSRNCHSVFTFVLDKIHIMKINGIECVTLGHGLEENVVKHPYFGTQRIIEDLKEMKGWNLGFVKVMSPFVRDSKTGLVSGLRSKVRKNEGISLENSSVCV